MQKKIQLITIVLTGALVALPVFAQINVGVNATATVGSGTVGASISGKISAAIISRAQTKADQEIARRIKALNALESRVNQMKKLSNDEKTTLTTEIQAQITAMNNLQAQITADINANATSSLKADIQSITKAYRIFALIIPQGAIMAASDRVEATVGVMNDLAAKLQARISSSTSANVSGAQSALADFNLKVADANTQAQAAVTETASLTPDNGNQTQMQANIAALKDARSKIQAAQADFVAARKDVQTIIQDLKLKVDVSATATTTAE